MPTSAAHYASTPWPLVMSLLPIAFAKHLALQRYSFLLYSQLPRTYPLHCVLLRRFDVIGIWLHVLVAACHHLQALLGVAFVSLNVAPASQALGSLSSSRLSAGIRFSLFLSEFSVTLFSMSRIAFHTLCRLRCRFSSGPSPVIDHPPRPRL